jgi:predicted RNA-binding Zn-ribbon protein involved in translation (DUF1610 family)
MAKIKQKVWYGCGNCGYKPEPDKDKSNENWNVYNNQPCPSCGEKMSVHLGEQ